MTSDRTTADRTGTKRVAVTRNEHVARITRRGTKRWIVRELENGTAGQRTRRSTGSNRRRADIRRTRSNDKDIVGTDPHESVIIEARSKGAKDQIASRFDRPRACDGSGNRARGL